MRRRRSSRTNKSASRPIRDWKSDADYVADQDRESSWSSRNQPWGDAAATKFVDFGDWLGDRLCHDDKVADFGGNDGWASFCFYSRHKVKPLVVDCEPKRLDHADKKYRLPTYQSFLENMKELADSSIDWGFCSHTLEHTRDTARAMREMARVIGRGCYFVMPLESLSHAKKNHAHAICFTKMEGWVALLEKNGWVVRLQKQVSQFEAQMYAEPT